MLSYIFTAIVGIVLIVIGVFNVKGNISALHAYHRSRVSEEDKLPFGKMVGTGNVIIGIGIIIFSALSLVSEFTKNQVYTYIGIGIMVLTLIVGLTISFIAMKKYNKGIF